MGFGGALSLFLALLFHRAARQPGKTNPRRSRTEPLSTLSRRPRWSARALLIFCESNPEDASGELAPGQSPSESQRILRPPQTRPESPENNSSAIRSRR